MLLGLQDKHVTSVKIWSLNTLGIKRNNWLIGVWLLVKRTQRSVVPKVLFLDLQSQHHLRDLLEMYILRPFLRPLN